MISNFFMIKLQLNSNKEGEKMEERIKIETIQIRLASEGNGEENCSEVIISDIKIKDSFEFKIDGAKSCPIIKISSTKL